MIVSELPMPASPGWPDSRAARWAMKKEIVRVAQIATCASTNSSITQELMRSTPALKLSHRSPTWNANSTSSATPSAMLQSMSELPYRLVPDHAVSSFVESILGAGGERNYRTGAWRAGNGIVAAPHCRRCYYSPRLED